jgi:hypothetical protein
MKHTNTKPAEKSNTFGEPTGKRSITRLPPVASNEGACPLLYHSNHNSATLSEKKAYKPTNRQAKTFKVLDLNAKNWLKIYGREKIGILTLTFKENLTCMREAQRRWNSFSRQFNKHSKFKLLVKVAEPQKRGAVHYHCLIKTQKKIRGSINWELYESMGEAKTTAEKRKLGQQLGKSATPHLRDLWAWLRVTAEKTGFGRTELMPLKKPTHIKNYIGKYLEKDMRDNALKKDGKNQNMRLITYGKNAPKVANQQFSWVYGPASVFRRKLDIWAKARGFKNREEIRKVFGRSWCHHLRSQIMNDEILGTYLDKRWNELQNPNERNKAVYPWKGQLISGVYSENFEKRWNEYLTDDEGEVRTRTRSRSEERDHFNHYKLQKSNASKYEQYI